MRIIEDEPIIEKGIDRDSLIKDYELKFIKKGEGVARRYVHLVERKTPAICRILAMGWQLRYQGARQALDYFSRRG
jgi:hypothetical protein